MQIGVFIFYALVGILLAIPCCLLAGWDVGGFTIMAFAGPALLFAWFIIANLAGVIRSDHRRRAINFNWRIIFGKSHSLTRSGQLLIFWLFTLYALLPVTLHWSAMLLEKIGYKPVATLINTHRYMSLLYFPVVFIALLAIIVMATNAWDAAKNTWTRIVHR